MRWTVETISLRAADGCDMAQIIILFPFALCASLLASRIHGPRKALAS
jgi:hypothetical protein